MQRLNIIKHIEEKENKDIWDYKIIEIKTILYTKTVNMFYVNYYIQPQNSNSRYEAIHNREITNKSQIFNRLQYIKQSGYKFKEYQVVDDTLTIVFE